MAVEVSAPGRLCLFGEHQDFLGLSVIATAIDLDIRITATPRADSIFAIRKPDLADRDEADYDEFDGSAKLPYRHKRDYLRSATNVAREAGLTLSHGYDCEIRGRIPMNAGTSSSSALTIAWTTFLLATQEGEVDRSPEHIAWLGYLAEVEEHGEAGGMMDHYTSAVGNLLYIDCRKPVTVFPLPTTLEGFVLGDTGIPKNTVCTLRESRQATEAGVKFLTERIPGFDLKTTPMDQAAEYFPELPEGTRHLVQSHFINRDLCLEARAMLASGQVDEARLGQMLYEHQVQLRDGIGVSHPMLDRLIDAAMEAGALGGKLNGSGCGGAMFAYAPGKQEQVAEAINHAGGKAYIVRQRGGVSVTMN
ncbi:MAG: GHMP kinase [Armatimonadetes bacterium]|jgi:galactokinase|nr:GHMP kinase [Armatimonadota bacterium]